MAKVSDPIVIRECADIFNYCADEYGDITSNINKIISLLDDIRCNFDVSYFDVLAGQLYSIKANAYDMYILMQQHACNLNDTAQSLEVASPPFFDFISNIGIKSWWDQAYPIIEQIATVTGAITGVAAITAAPISFINWVRDKLQKKHTEDEYTWIKLILDEDNWSISILSQKLELPEVETKKILKGFGYKWDSKKMLYIASEHTHALRNIKVHNRISG